MNSFYGDLSLCQQLFLFKDVEDNHLNINFHNYKEFLFFKMEIKNRKLNKRKQIKELIDLTDPISPKLLTNDIIFPEPKYNKGRTTIKNKSNRYNIKPRIFKKSEINFSGLSKRGKKRLSNSFFES